MLFQFGRNLFPGWMCVCARAKVFVRLLFKCISWGSRVCACMHSVHSVHSVRFNFEQIENWSGDRWTTTSELVWFAPTPTLFYYSLWMFFSVPFFYSVFFFRSKDMKNVSKFVFFFLYLCVSPSLSPSLSRSLFLQILLFKHCDTQTRNSEKNNVHVVCIQIFIILPRRCHRRRWRQQRWWWRWRFIRHTVWINSS